MGGVTDCDIFRSISLDRTFVLFDSTQERSVVNDSNEGMYYELETEYFG